MLIQVIHVHQLQIRGKFRTCVTTRSVLFQIGRNDVMSTIHTRTILCLSSGYIPTLYQQLKKFKIKRCVTKLNELLKHLTLFILSGKCKDFMSTTAIMKIQLCLPSFCQLCRLYRYETSVETTEVI